MFCVSIHSLNVRCAPIVVCNKEISIKIKSIENVAFHSQNDANKFPFVNCIHLHWDLVAMLLLFLLINYIKFNSVIFNLIFWTSLIIFSSTLLSKRNKQVKIGSKCSETVFWFSFRSWIYDLLIAKYDNWTLNVYFCRTLPK